MGGYEKYESYVEWPKAKDALLLPFYLVLIVIFALYAMLGMLVYSIHEALKGLFGSVKQSFLKVLHREERGIIDAKGKGR